MLVNRELLVVIGDPVVELVASTPLAAANGFERRLGGQAVSVGLHAAREGLPTALVTRIGDDAFADWIMEGLEGQGVHLDHARRMPGRNSIRLVGSDGASTEYRDCAPATTMDAEHCASVPWELARYVFACGGFQALGGTAAAAVRRCFELARAGGAKTIFHSALTSDQWPGGPRAATAAFDEVADLIDILVISSPYASGRLLSQPEPNRAVVAALDRGVTVCLAFQDWGLAAVADGTAGRKAEDLAGWDGQRSLLRFVVALHRGMSAFDAARYAVNLAS